MTQKSKLSINKLFILPLLFASGITFVLAIFTLFNNTNNRAKYDPITFAASKTVATSTQLQAAVNEASAGDTIFVENAQLTTTLTIANKNGTASSPITIKAKNRKGVTFSGSAQVVIKNSKYIQLEGFVISGKKYNPLLIESSENIRVTRNYFNVAESTSTNSIWLYVKGKSKNIRIDHNDFRDKKSAGQFIAIHGDGSTMSQYTRIDHNYFKNNSPRIDNGKESIQIGLAAYTYSPAYTTIEDNLFEGCDGDPEIISIKSSNNTIQNNTLINNKGMIVLRHGNNSVVAGNSFFGPEYGSGGVRVHGLNHKVSRNYFENLRGVNSWGAIVVPQGDQDEGSRTLTGHFRAVNTEIDNNVMLNNDFGIVIGNSSSKAPRNTVITNNKIKSNRGTLINYINGENTTWTNNKADSQSGAKIGISLSTSQLKQEAIILKPYADDNGASIRKILNSIRKLSPTDVGPDSDQETQVASPTPANMPTAQPIPTPASAVNITTPVKTALIYQILKDRNTNQEVGIPTLATKLPLWVIHRGFEDKARAAKAAGNKGPILQYIISDALVGPDGISKNSQCTASQKSFQPWTNNITLTAGSFCEIHDSIITRKAFDHDLNPSTPEIAATENWFLHDSNGNRIKHGTGGGTGYYPNPGEKNVKEYFAGRMLKEKERTPGVFDGFFLDNIGLSWENVKNFGQPVEYSSSYQYADAVYEFTKYLYQKVSRDAKYPVYANLIGGNNNGIQWDRYTTALDGAMLESFALNWGKGSYPAQTIENQLNQTAKWITSGKSLIAIAQGTDSNSANQAKYALAAFLLVTDGQNGYFHYTDYNRMYNYLYEYQEYTAKLGAPLGSMVKKSDTPLIYSRQFKCGSVELNISSTTGTITTTSCGSSPLPSATPSPVPVVTAIPTVPTSTPRPTVTPAAPSAFSSLTIVAGGNYSGSSYPILNIVLDDKVVKSLTINSKSPINFYHNFESKVQITRLKFAFANDGETRDLRIDRVILDGNSYESTAPTVYSTGSWSSSNGCGPGYKKTGLAKLPRIFPIQVNTHPSQISHNMQSPTEI